MPVTIRQAETTEDRQRVFRFRYEIYVEEMQRPQTYADHQARTIIEPFDATGHIFLAEDQAGQIVGTVRTNFARDTDFGYYRELYGMECVGEAFPEHVSITTKLMVAPRERSSTLAHRLCTKLYCFGLAEGILFDFIDCNPHLEGHFQRLGYCRYRDRIQHPEYGDVLPMILPVNDLGHLESVDSPWVRDCREFPRHQEANRHVHQVIHTYQTKRQAQAA